MADYDMTVAPLNQNAAITYETEFGHFAFTAQLATAGETPVAPETIRDEPMLPRREP